MQYDAIVIGGGYFGCACGYFLAKSGVRTLLVDEKEIGRGASGANFGNVQVQDSSMGINLQLTLDGFKLMQEMEKELDSDIGYRPCRSLVGAEAPAHLPLLEKEYQEKKEAGLDIRWLEGGALYDLEPNINPDSVLAATYFEQGQVYPFHYMYALLRRGKQKGLTVKENCPVASLHMEGGQCKGIVLEDGSVIRAENTIVAAGAGTHTICRSAGLSVPVHSVKAECFVTESIAPFLNAYYSSAAFFAEAHDPEKASTSLCVSQSHYGNLLLAETTKPHDLVDKRYQDATSLEHCRAIREKLAHFAPAAAHLQILRSWVTPSPFTNNTEPVFGKSPVSGLILAAGFKSAVVLSALVGTVVTELVLHDTCRYDIAPFMNPVSRL